MNENAQRPESLEGIGRIVFLGDSITQNGNYVTDVECWLLTRGYDIEVINAGLSSETATDLTPDESAEHLNLHGFARPQVSERLSRTLEATRPELLIVCYGMNDGSSLPPGDHSLERFSDAVTRLRETALAAGAKRVVLCTPPIHDNMGCSDPDPHEENLTRFSEWLVSKRADRWDVVDIHGPMKAELAERRKANPGFTFQPDGVHPDRDGHWLMAREILIQLLDADLSGVSSAEQLLANNGDAIRELVYKRCGILLSAYLTRIGHTRPGVPGGPGESPGPPIEDACEQARAIGDDIRELLV